jgi:peroxiredoxin
MHKTIKAKIIILTAACITILISTSTMADLKSIDVGAKVGDQAPQIVAIDTKGQPKTIKELSLEKGLILVFFRSADWCPYCKRHLIELNEYSDKFTKLGYGVAAISYDTIDILKTFSTERMLKFPMLSDQKAATFLSYGILNKKYKLGSDDYGIPYPGVIIINSEGKITKSYFYQGYKKRVKFDKLLQQLK